MTVCSAHAAVPTFRSQIEVHRSESMASVLMRACDANYVSPHIFSSSAGLSSANLGLAATNRKVSPETLAAMIGVAPDEIAVRRHRKTSANYFLFHQALLPKAERVAKARRLSPASLRRQPIHREIYSIRSIPFCAETMSLLTEVCLNPVCGARLGWSKRTAIHICEHCGADQREFDTLPVPAALRSDLRFANGLLDPSSQRRTAALKRIPSELRRFGRGELFVLLSRLGSIERRRLAPKGSSSQLRMTYRIARGAYFLRNLDTELLGVLKKAAAAEPNPVRTTAIAVRLRDIIASPHISEELRTHLRTIFADFLPTPEPYAVRARDYRRKHELLTGRELAKRAKLTAAEILSLRDAGIITGPHLAGAKRQHVWYEAATAEKINEARATCIGTHELKTRYGMSTAMIEQLHCTGC